MEVAPGAFLLKACLSLEQQRVIVESCRALIDGDVPGYVPVVRGGGKMHVRMLCLGRHWNGQTYRYEQTRTDFDRLEYRRSRGLSVISPATSPHR